LIDDLGPLPPVVKPNCRVTYYVKIERDMPPIRERADVVADSFDGAIWAFWRQFNPQYAEGPVMSVIVEGVERI